MHPDKLPWLSKKWLALIYVTTLVIGCFIAQVALPVQVAVTALLVVGGYAGVQGYVDARRPSWPQGAPTPPPASAYSEPDYD